MRFDVRVRGMKCRKCGFTADGMDYCPTCSNPTEGMWQMLVPETTPSAIGARHAVIEECIRAIMYAPWRERDAHYYDAGKLAMETLQTLPSHEKHRIPEGQGSSPASALVNGSPSQAAPGSNPASAVPGGAVSSTRYTTREGFIFDQDGKFVKLGDVVDMLNGQQSATRRSEDSNAG